MCCPFCSLPVTHSETFSFVYSLSRHELDFIQSSLSCTWTHVSLIRLWTDHFGDVSLGFCYTSPLLTENRAHLAEQNQRLPCPHGYTSNCTSPVLWQNTHAHTSADTNPTLQSKAMQTHLRCAWLRLPALEWCDRILARHSWSSALTWGRRFLTRYMYILEWWKLFLTGCLDVLSSYNDKPELHYFVGNRQVLMKRLNFLLESFRWKPFFSRNWGVRREVQFSSQGSVKPKRGFCLGQWVIFCSSNHSEKQEKSVSTVHSWPLHAPQGSTSSWIVGGYGKHVSRAP